MLLVPENVSMPSCMKPTCFFVLSEFLVPATGHATGV